MDCREKFEKIVKDIKIHMEMLCTDEIRRHACASTDHDLQFQIFRILGGYDELLQERKNLRQESKPITVDEKIVWEAIGRLYENGTNDLKDCDIISQAIHDALPSQPDIEQLKADVRSYADAANNWESVAAMQAETIAALINTNSEMKLTN